MAIAFTSDKAGQSKYRPTVLVPINYYLPGYKSGGPMRAVASMTEALGDEFHFRIITWDRDFGDKQPYTGIERNRLMRVGKADVLYVEKGKPLSVLRQVLKTPHDILYLKSFFSPQFSIWPLWLATLGILRTTSIVIAPCGSFSPGALGIKRFRKRLYIAIARKLSVYKRAIWHATSEYEEQDIRREMRASKANGVVSDNEKTGPEDRDMKVMVASELNFFEPSEPCDEIWPAKVPGKLNIVFLSRISRKKNLDGALNLLRGLRGDVIFDVYGPAEDRRYWAECERIIAGLPGNIRVQYRGSVPHQDVGRILAGYHLFSFPTLGENFGYVILEALLAGCPLLISDTTPWRDLEHEGVGWDLPLDSPELFRAVLQRCIDMGPGEHRELSERARAFGRRRSQAPEILSCTRALLQMAALAGMNSNAAAIPQIPVAKQK